MVLPAYFKGSFNSPTPEDRVWIFKPAPAPGRHAPLTIPWSGYTYWNRFRLAQWDPCVFFALELVTGGEGVFFSNGKEYPVKSGILFIHRPGNREHFTVGKCGFLQKRYVSIGGPHLETLLESLGLKDADVVEVKDVIRVKKLMQESNRIIGLNGADALLSLSSIAYALLIELSKSIDPIIYEPALQRSLAFIDESLYTTIDNASIACKAGVSITHLHRLFRKRLSTSPVKYALTKKMMLAQQLLLATQHSVKQIAAMLDYDNPLFFSTHFTRITGRSPTQFRKQKR